MGKEAAQKNGVHSALSLAAHNTKTGTKKGDILYICGQGTKENGS